MISSASILRATKRSDYTGNDILSGFKDTSIILEKKGKKGGMNCCSASGPNLSNCPNKTGTPGISLHYFPLNESLQNKWTLLVRRHRKDFNPKKTSCLCLVHFEERCFEHKPVLVTTDNGQAIQLKRNLIKGSIPTKDTVIPLKSPLTDHKWRNVSISICYHSSDRLPCVLFMSCFLAWMKRFLHLRVKHVVLRIINICKNYLVRRFVYLCVRYINCGLNRKLLFCHFKI